MIWYYKVHPTDNVTNVLRLVSIFINRLLNLLMSSYIRPCPRRTRYSISSLHIDCALDGSLQMRIIRVACENAIAF